MVCDARSSYCLNAIPYLGKEGHPEMRQGQLQGHYFTMRLLAPIMRPDMVVCCDNWFTSLDLVRDLTRHNMGLVGTVRPKKNLPHVAVKALNIPVGESVALYNHIDKVNMVVTKVKDAKSVSLLSTEHHAFSYVEPPKTEIHMYYNAAKGGVDSFDQRCAASNTSRKTRRWPLCVFYNLLNIIINNSYIIYASREENAGYTRHWFNQNLAYNLAKPFVTERLQGPRGIRLAPHLKSTIENTFHITHTPQQAAAQVDEEIEQDIDEPAPIDQGARDRPVHGRWPLVKATKHQNDPKHPPRNDPKYPGFPGGKVKTTKRQRCPFGPKTKESEDSTAGTKDVRSTWTGNLLCNQCNAAVCNVHSANLCPNCFQNLKYDHHD